MCQKCQSGDSKIISDYLTKVQQAATTNEKKAIAMQLFEFLIDNRSLIDNHSKFAQTVKAKIEEFSQKENWRLERIYYELFYKNL